MNDTGNQLYLWALTRLNPKDNVAPGDFQEIRVLAYDVESAREWAYRHAVRAGNQDERIWIDGDDSTLLLQCFREVAETAKTSSRMVVATRTWSNFAPVFYPGDPIRCPRCGTEKVEAVEDTTEVLCENDHLVRGIPVFSNRGLDSLAHEDRRAAEHGWRITRYGRIPVYVCEPGRCNIQEHSHNFPMTQAESDEYAHDMPYTDACTACGADLELEPGVGWVDALSGDAGGTYVHCPESGDGEHRPERHITPNLEPSRH